MEKNQTLPYQWKQTCLEQAIPKQVSIGKYLKHVRIIFQMISRTEHDGNCWFEYMWKIICSIFIENLVAHKFKEKLASLLQITQ